MSTIAPKTERAELAHGSRVPLGRSAARVLGPLAAAIAVVWLEPMLGQLAQERPGIIPVAVLALVMGLITRGSRQWLVVTLCFGMSLLAVRDAIRSYAIPDALPVTLHLPLFVRLYPVGWMVLALLAAAAAVGESLQPGAVWARRCYFLAAAFYFTGHGMLSFLREPTWQSPVLVVIGMVSIVGAWLADRVVDQETEAEILDDDLKALAERSDQRAADLAHREWFDPGFQK